MNTMPLDSVTDNLQLVITRIEKFRLCYTPNPLGVSNPTLRLSGSPTQL